MSTENLSLDDISWDENGLIPAIAQCAETGTVLMLAWMNAEALQLTLNEGVAVYWSRSRQKIWRKGETSGHVQIVKELRIDCDRDCVLMKVRQEGGIACHTGRQSCFYTKYDWGKWVETEKVIKSPKEIYNS